MLKKHRICGRQIMLEQSPEDYFRKSITVHFLYCTLNEMKTRLTDLHVRQEPLWDYSWFHQLLKILLHNWAPPPSTESLDPPLYAFLFCRVYYYPWGLLFLLFISERNKSIHFAEDHPINIPSMFGFYWSSVSVEYWNVKVYWCS
jgi:hypothetical protein